MSETNMPDPESPAVTVFPSWEEMCFPNGHTPWDDNSQPASTDDEQGVAPYTSRRLYDGAPDAYPGTYLDEMLPQFTGQPSTHEFPEGTQFLSVSGCGFGLAYADLVEIVRLLRGQLNRLVRAVCTLDGHQVSLVVEANGESILFEIYHQDHQRKHWVKIPMADKWDVASMIVGGES